MRRAYLDPNKVISNHIDRRWQDLPNLIPIAATARRSVGLLWRRLRNRSPSSSEKVPGTR